MCDLIDGYEQNNYVLSYCADFAHAKIGENANSGEMEYAYSLSNMTNDERLAFSKERFGDCEATEFLSGSNVIYKKRSQVSSNASNAKVSAILIDKGKPMTNFDNVSLILKDMIGKAATEMLTDNDMLQALKDYRLAGSKTPQPLKVITAEPTIKSQTVNLDNYKAKCKDLGFKEGSKDYGNCVLQLME